MSQNASISLPPNHPLGQHHQEEKNICKHTSIAKKKPSSRLKKTQGRRKDWERKEKLRKIKEFYQGILDFSRNLGVAGKSPEPPEFRRKIPKVTGDQTKRIKAC
ncbi:unnamed protein product [Cuscuta epithymum]|uniref:Uncharacterized protein n=1 Tax=Cuscuta epithymum TaxID=186058 RepID=A0AAV0F5Y8_9ASTE|nr:unnamed protein product [Cuscuta epithymum]CAH9130835.1 unnamed protein product [Cuscuta epithymum]